MQGMRYIEDVVTLKRDAEKCTGCRACTIVCPHGVFAMADKRAIIVDLGACMECGACATNCAPAAITLKPGVGCADAIIRGWLTGTEPSCGCSSAPAGDDSCCGDAAKPSGGGSCC
jgi:NAD-dependent dihydropyrimidine dehydrogenase PreA subunit